MDNNTALLLIFIAVVCVMIFYSKCNAPSASTIDNFDNIVSDNIIIRDGKVKNKYNNYDYATLSNGSIQKINEIIQSVVDNNNCGGRLIMFNPGLSPIIRCEIERKEFDEYGEFLVIMMNNNITYKCFTFVSSEPEYKIKTENQVKMQFHINVLYKHPDNENDEIMLRFLVVLLNDNPYCEYGNFNEEPTAEQLPFDIVASEGKTYIEVFTMDEK
jgi:hypothetical protein